MESKKKIVEFIETEVNGGCQGLVSGGRVNKQKVLKESLRVRHDFTFMLSKSLIQFSVDGWGYVPSLMFDLRPNYGRGNEDNGNLLQKDLCMHCCIQCP